MNRTLARAAFRRAVGLFKQAAGRVTANRLLEFKGRQDELRSRILRRLAHAELAGVDGSLDLDRR
jgi:uncharacterized protein YjbJ (UPF0337 family)